MEKQHATLVKKEDLPDWAQFQASLSNHPIILDEHGVLCYQKNPLINWLCDHVDLNQMRIAYHHGAFSREAFMQFYRDIGYSLDGYADVWADELEEMKEQQSR